MKLNTTQRVMMAITAALVAAGCARLPFSDLVPEVIEPSIRPSTSVTGSTQVDRSFTFEDARITLQVPVDEAVYAGARGAAKTAIFTRSSRPANWVAGYYRAFVTERHQAPFYASLAQALHQVRASQRLDVSRYVELVTSMGQALTYKVDRKNLAPKFPIETFGDGYGDCDDKTLLAASALSRDGYDVAILVFGPEQHVALGVRAPGLDYRGTGYAYVEMTRPSLVGIPPKELSDGVKLTSQPEVIRIGHGTKRYEAGAQIVEIQRRLAQVEAAIPALRKEIDSGNADLKAQQSRLRDERDALSGITDMASLVAATNTYNEHVADFNAAVAQVNRTVERYNTLVKVERYFAGHQTERPQVYEQLRNAPL